MEIIIANQYKIIKELGEGNFGKVFESIDIKNNKKCAIKIENKNIDLLKKEAKIYNYLKNNIYIPSLLGYGTIQDYRYLIIELLEISLNEIDFTILNNKYSILLVEILEFIHSKNLIHRDIKPDNFLFAKQKNSIKIIDFGLSKFYKINEKHIDFCDNKKLIGTPNYCSLNVHNSNEYSRRDDLESLLYTIFKITGVVLPWINKDIQNFNNKLDYYQEIKFLKEKDFSWLDNYYREYLILIKYSRNLKFEDKPNYKYIKNLLINLDLLIN